jgi:Uma2 family endonuclease
MQGKATAADLADRERHEVVDGCLVEKPGGSADHGFAHGGVAGALGFIPGWAIGMSAQIEFEPHEVYLPDIAGWRTQRTDRRLKECPVHLKLDWVCEVLAPETAVRDLGVKRRTYHRARVGHYWIVKPVDQVLTVYRWHPDGYLLVMAAGPDELVRAEPFEALELAVSRIFGL